MQRLPTLQGCIAHQQSALATLRQYLEDQRHLGVDQPDPGPAVRPSASNSQLSAPSSTPSKRRRTILQVARESKLKRLIGLTSDLVNLEQNSLLHLKGIYFQVEFKLSVDLRNTCERLATREDCLRLDGDLKAVEECLRSLVNQLLLSLSSDNSGSQLEVTDPLKRLSQKYLNI
ncbi:leukemia-associated protein 7 [Hemitrygon akajei]|uniref:leukemia-associated protein 7 n=1 Tax=Hemitrygon akajei TaxID=2704970 RepID=UPI003BF9CFD9